MLLRFPPIRSLLAVCLASFALAAALIAAFGSFTPLWYANAVGVAALLRHPRRTWPVLLLALYGVHALAFALFGSGAALAYAACHAAEIGLVALLIQQFAGMPGPLLEGTRFVRMTAVFLLVPAFSACAGALAASWTQGASFMHVFQAWYLASSLGLLVGGVSMLGWTDGGLRKAFLQHLSRRRSTVLLVGALAAALLVHERDHQAAIFLTFPLMFALTWSFGLLGVTVALLLTTVSAVLEALQGHGAFILLAPLGSGVEERLETVQLYLAALLLSSMPLAVMQEKQNVLTARVRSAAQARSEFLAAMSHEIRTPMTGVLSMVDLLAAEALSARQRSYVETMQTSGRHLLSVVNDILDFSRIESGRLDLERADFELAELAESVRSIMLPLAAERGIGLELELACEFPSTLVGDPLRIKQVLLNLVSNAVKFTSAGGVHVRIERLPAPDPGPGAAWLRFEVRDTGVGIEPEQLERLFAPFVQADSSISRQYGGSGLGLAISKRLVELMHGRIGAESTPGQGSVFRFELPLQVGEVLPPALESDSRVSEIPPLRILVAEDIDTNRRILQVGLERLGHTLAFAANGAEALEQVQDGDYDLVLMDVQMPVMDGVEATRRIRRLAGPKARTPILGLTANVMAREREQYLSAGMDDCLMKPFDWAQLAAAIAHHGGRRPAAPERKAAARPPATTGLLDEAAFENLGTEDAAELASLVGRALDGFAAACARMLAPAAGADDIRREAHQIRGTAGMLGLRAVCEQAGRVESAPDAVDTGQHLAALRDSIERTTGLLRARGLLAAAPESRELEEAA